MEEILDPRLLICDPHHHLWDHPGSRYVVEELGAYKTAHWLGRCPYCPAHLARASSQIRLTGLTGLTRLGSHFGGWFTPWAGAPGGRTDGAQPRRTSRS
jgi:hypothetical protein